MRANRFWQIAYPMAVYYLMYHFLHILFLVITGGRLGSLECLTLASAITLVVMVVCYRKLPITRAISEKRTIAQVLQWIRIFKRMPTATVRRIAPVHCNT